MHKVFISYHHQNDQEFKEELLRFNDMYQIFIDASVDTRDIDERLDDQTIRAKIRDDYLRNSTVTMVLVGSETKGRKHVDWELYSSMIDGQRNKKSGILVVQLPHVSAGSVWSNHANEQEDVYPAMTGWTTYSSRADYEAHFPYLSDRLIDNVIHAGAKISVTTWEHIARTDALRFLINSAHNDRASCDYDLSRPMRRHNS